MIVLLTLLLALMVATCAEGAALSTHRRHHRAKAQAKVKAAAATKKDDDEGDSADDDSDDASDDTTDDSKDGDDADSKDDDDSDDNVAAAATGTMSGVAAKPDQAPDVKIEINLPHKPDAAAAPQDTGVVQVVAAVKSTAAHQAGDKLESHMEHKSAEQQGWHDMEPVWHNDDPDPELQVAAYFTPEGRLTKARQALQDNLRQQAKITALELDMQNETGFQKRVDQETQTLGGETQSPQLAAMLSGMRKEMRQFSRPFYLEHLISEQKRLKAEEATLQDDLAAAERDYGAGNAGWPSPGKKTLVAETAFRRPDFLQSNSSSPVLAQVSPKSAAINAGAPAAAIVMLAGLLVAA